MITVNIAYDVSADKVEAIKAMLDNELDYNVNLNGADYEIEREDYTSVDNCDEYIGAALLSKINHIIENK